MTLVEDTSIELVITSPAPYGAQLAYMIRSRLTLGALTQLIAQARNSIIIASPFLQANYGLHTGPLADALRAALKRRVAVDILTTGAGLESLAIDELRNIGQGCLRLFQPRANVQDARQLGSHAKFCVADNEHAYIGSANFTGPGLFGNLEMGLLVHGDMAQQIRSFWEILIRTDFFVEVSL